MKTLPDTCFFKDCLPPFDAEIQDLACLGYKKNLTCVLKEDVKRYTKFFQQTSTITTDTEAKIPDSIIELIWARN